MKTLIKKVYWGVKGFYLELLRKIGRFDIGANIRFYDTFHKWIDWKNPKDINEIINYLSFKTDTSLWTICADKYAMRQFVVERLGKDENLVPLIGKWDTAEDIDFELLPNKFVIKTNNGSFDAVIVRDKSTAQLESIRRKMVEAQSRRFGYESFEPHYLRIKPCIIAEKLLETDNPLGLIDYKCWCFNGEPYCFLVCSNRDNSSHSGYFNYYTIDWENKPEKMSVSVRNEVEIPRPEHLEEMLDIAKQLSVGFPQIRVNFYEVDGIVYVGELTLTAGQGRMTRFTNDTLLEMGAQVNIDLCLK